VRAVATLAKLDQWSISRFVPRARFLNLPAKDRAKLLAVATTQFARRGFDGASLNAILAAAGLSKGAYYYYFDDKEDLFATVIESALDTVLAHIARPSLTALTREQFWPQAEAVVAQWAEAWEASSELFQVVIHVSEAMRRSPRFEAIMARGRELYRPVIEAGRRLGCIRTDLTTDQLVRLFEANDQALDSMLLMRHPKLTRRALEGHIALVFDTFRRLLEAERPSPPQRPRRLRG
jgi:AcrR family transcriptional regulator